MNDWEGRLGFALCQRGRGGISLTEELNERYQAGLKLLTTLETCKSDVSPLCQPSCPVGDIAQWVSAGKMRAPHTNTQHYRIPFVRISRYDRRSKGVADAFLRLIKNS